MSKRKSLSIAEKMELLNNVDSGVKKKEVAIKFGIPQSSLSTIIKNRESIIKLYEESGPNRKRSKTCRYEDVDESVLKWVKMVCDRNIPVSGSLIKEKAAEYARILGHWDFQASSGWLEKFKKRHGIQEKVNFGDSERVNEANCTQWKDIVLKAILEDYEPDNIFSVGEAGLFFKCLPHRIHIFKKDECNGGKNSKERITIMVGANMSGKEKLKLLVIGKSKHPKCFKGVKSLEVDYNYNKNSWMTSDIFEKWVLDLDKKMKNQKRKIVLLVDNCPAHPPSVASKPTNIKLIFFPTNATSKLQPMHQGVIKNLKIHYRKRVLSRLISALETNQPLSNVVNLRISVAELAKVWQNDIAELTIKNCFAKACFTKSVLLDNDDQGIPPIIQECWIELQSKGMALDDASLNDFLEIDNNVVVAEYPTDEEILSSVQKENPEINEIGDELDEVIKPSKQEMLVAFEMLRRGLQCEEDVPDMIFQCLNKCEHYYEETLLKTYFQQGIIKVIKQEIPE